MNELHVVSENDELSTRNGSAVLRVAMELQRAAVQEGRLSVIGGGKDKIVDLPGVIELLESHKNNGTFRSLVRLFDKISKFSFGFSIQKPRVLEVDSGRFGHIFCHNQPWIGARVRGRFPEAKIHLYVHNRVMLGATPMSIRRALRRYDSIVCVSDFIRDDLIRRARFPDFSSERHRFSTIFNGVDYKQYDGPVSEEIEEVDVVFVGRIIPEKGTDILAESIGSIHSGILNRVRIVGGSGFLPTGSLSNFELDVVRVLENSSAEFIMTGPVRPSSIPDLINSAKIIVVPSVWDEPCALVFLEGLASGAAVIASRVGGLPEVGPGAGAIFVEPGDPEALANAIEKLLCDPPRRQLLVADGQRWARNRPWNRVYNELMESVC